MKTALTILLLCLCQTLLSSQNEPAYVTMNITSDLCYKYADSLSIAGNMEEAISHFSSCLGIAQNPADSLLIYTEIALQYYYFGVAENGIKYLEEKKPTQVYPINEENIYALYRKNRAWYLLNRSLRNHTLTSSYLDSSSYYLRKLPESEFLQANILKEQSIVLWRMNENERAVDAIRSSNGLLNLIPSSPKTIKLKSDNFMMNGLIDWRQHKHSSAIDHYQAALSGYKSLPELNYRDLYATANNTAILFQSLDQLDSCLYYLNLSQEYLDVIDKNSSNKTFVKTYDYFLTGNFAQLYFQQEKYEEAFQYANAAIRKCENAKGPVSPDLLNLLNHLIYQYLHRNNFPEAYSSAVRALSIAKKSFDPHNEQITVQYLYMSETLRHKVDQQEKSYLYLDSAFYNMNISIKDNEVSYSQFEEYCEAVALQLQYLSEDDLTTDILIDKIFLNFSKNYVNTLLNGETKAVRENIDEILDQLYSYYYHQYAFESKMKKAHRLLEISEVKKARNFIREHSIRHYLLSTIPPDLKKREASLRDSINVYQQNSISSADQLRMIKIKHQILLDSILYNYKGNSPFLSKNTLPITKVQNNLDGDECLLSFYIIDSTVYFLTLYQDDQHIGHFKSNFEKTPADTIWKNINLKQGIGSVNIVPDEFIWRVNLESVHLNETCKKCFVGTEYGLRYQFSLVSQQSLQDRYETSNNTVYGISYKDTVHGRHFLKGAQGEMEVLSSLWPSKFKNSTSNKRSFSSALSKSVLTHIAVHARANLDNLNEPEFILNENGKQDSSTFSSIDILNLKISSELISIASCKGGTGKIDKLEGSLSLGRALLISGARSVMASREDILDSSAKQIYTSFYQNLKKGMKKSEALRVARKEYVTNAIDKIMSDPIHWSNFYILGDDRPIASHLQSRMLRDFKIAALGIISLMSLYLIFKLVQKNLSS